MASQPTAYQVVILTTRHSFAGELSHHSHRLSDFLNDRREAMIALENIQVARLRDPGKILQRHASALIPKVWITAAFEPPQQAIPVAHRFYGYVRKQTHDVFAVLDGMELRGILHTAGEFDARRILTASTDSFLPITKATITLYANDQFVIQQDTVMVNATRIRYLAKIEPSK